MSAATPLPHQQRPKDVVLPFLPLGMGKTFVMLEAIKTLCNGRHRTTLVATSRHLQGQWRDKIKHYVREGSRVLDLRNSARFVENLTEWEPGLSISLDELAATSREDWELAHPEPYFFLVTFHQVKKCFSSWPEKWFDVTIEDEGYRTPGMLAVQATLRKVGQTYVRFGDPRQGSYLPPRLLAADDPRQACWNAFFQDGSFEQFKEAWDRKTIRHLSPQSAQSIGRLSIRTRN